MVALLSLFAPGPARAQQKVNTVEQAQARGILHQIATLIEKQYYDPTLHGFDLQSRVQQAEHQIDAAPNLAVGVGAVEWAVEGLNDSHTFFVPPMRNVIVDPGWKMELVGDRCMIYAVQQDSDAWKRGLRPGDEVLKIETYEPRRATFSKIDYRLNDFAPLAEYHFVVASPEQSSRALTVKSRMQTLPQTWNGFTGGDGQHQMRRLFEGYRILGESRTAKLNDKVFIWKLPEFNLKDTEIEHLVDGAKKHDVFILDLRDNEGGGEDSLKAMIANFFDGEVVAGRLIERQGSSPLHYPTRGQRAFTGKLFVLVNSQSASASELFARIVQLNKRGTVIGDHTAGEVGRGKFLPLQFGDVSIISYGLQVTVSRFETADGQDLEGKGVTPDVQIIPTAADLASGRDPVLAEATRLAGSPISPEDAGKLFPVKWLSH